MKLREVTKNRRAFFLFCAIAVLVLLQVGWWTSIFIHGVNEIAALKEEHAVFQRSVIGAVSPISSAEIQREAFHRRVMFLSESVFFSLITCLGLYLLFRSLRAEAKSREMQRNFIEIMSHESKTPVTALKLRLESLRESLSSSPDRDREVGSALEQVARLSSIFEKSLSLNRIERQVFHFETVAMADVVDEVIHSLDPMIRSKAVKVSLDLDAEARVCGDLYFLRNSVQNLVENAIAYNQQPDRRVAIELKRSGQDVLLSVADNGPGIAVGDAPRLFERFFRGARDKSVPGTGLGLYLTRVILEAHEGAIRLVQSSVGARFEVRLPLEGEAV